MQLLTRSGKVTPVHIEALSFKAPEVTVNPTYPAVSHLREAINAWELENVENQRERKLTRILEIALISSFAFTQNALCNNWLDQEK